VITKEEGMYKRGATGNAVRPKFSILNPALTETLPPLQTGAGITDICAHLYERYLTNTKEVEVTDRLIEALLLTMKHEGPRVIADPHNYEARANIMWAGMMAHNNAVGVGRSQDWTSHDVEHELSALYDCAHGAGLAVTMPAVFKYVMNHDVMRFAKVATRVWGCQMDFDHPEVTALEGINAFRNFLIGLGMPKNFEELGAKEEDIPKLVEVLCRGNGRNGTIGGFVELNEEDCTKIYKMMI
jgi:alcohol dehydrogenase YqhD (iron-dependent ADH family)